MTSFTKQLDRLLKRYCKTHKTEPIVRLITNRRGRLIACHEGAQYALERSTPEWVFKFCANPFWMRWIADRMITLLEDQEPTEANIAKRDLWQKIRHAVLKTHDKMYCARRKSSNYDICCEILRAVENAIGNIAYENEDTFNLPHLRKRKASRR